MDGAVIPLAHRTETFAADGLVWVLRILTGEAPNAPTDPDPFLPPYDARLRVAELGPKHTLLLNKFPVLAGHLLVVTRAAMPQAGFPDAEDFAATAKLLVGRPAMAFYNGGRESGASQPHRHFQTVSLPLGPQPAEPVPIRPWIEHVAAGGALPFPGAAVALSPESWQRHSIGAKLYETGEALLRQLGVDSRTPGSFNLLFTREWMLVVPRRIRRYRSVSVNSLGYAGALIAKSDASVRALRELGPLEILRGTAAER